MANAIKDYKAAIDINPSSFGANYNLGALYFNTAIEINNKANASDGNVYDKLKKQAKGLFAKALPYLEEAYALNSKDKNTLLSLKQLYYMSGDYKKSEEMKKEIDINAESLHLSPYGLEFVGKQNFQQGSLLSQTDWAYIRHYDSGIDVPAKIETWRNAIRAKATEMENAIDNSTDIDAIASLFLSWDNEAEANSMDKFREAAAKTLDITILSIKEIEALIPQFPVST